MKPSRGSSSYGKIYKESDDLLFAQEFEMGLSVALLGKFTTLGGFRR